MLDQVNLLLVNRKGRPVRSHFHVCSQTHKVLAGSQLITGLAQLFVVLVLDSSGICAGDELDQDGEEAG